MDPRAVPLHDFVHPVGAGSSGGESAYPCLCPVNLRLHSFRQPRAVYVLGAEDTGLPYHLKRACTHLVCIPTDPQVRGCRMHELIVEKAGDI